MTIKRLDGPPDGQKVMMRELGKRIPAAARFATPLGGAPQAGSPVPFYHLGLEDLTKQSPLSKATVTGWRFPIVGGIHPGLAIIAGMADGSSSTFEGLSHGLIAARFIQAALLANEKLGSDVAEYEPRLLDVPALQFAALWLHGQKNWFIPLLEGRPLGTAPLAMVSSILPDLRARAAKRVAPDAPVGAGTPTN